MVVSVVPAVPVAPGVRGVPVVRRPVLVKRVQRVGWVRPLVVLPVVSAALVVSGLTPRV
jgi:hypothetical protein